MKSLITENIGLKLLSLLMAAVLWFLCINITDPVTQDSYNVTVQMKNMKAMTNMGKYVEVADGSDRVRVTVRGTRSVLSSFTADNITAVADLTQIDQNNQVPVTVSTTKVSDNIDSIKSDKDFITVNVENISKLQIPISVVVQNEPADGYILGSTGTAQNVLIISGPESSIADVKYAAVEVNVADTRSDVNISLPIHLYNEDDQILDTTKISMSKTEVTATASILETKELPVNCTVKGDVLDGYVLSANIDCEPQSITVAGKGNALKNAIAVNIQDAVDITGAVGDISADIDIRDYIPDGITLVNAADSVVRVTAHVQPEVPMEITLNPQNIHPTNVPDGMTVSLADGNDYVIKLMGEQDVMTTMDQNSLVAVLDIDKYMKAREIDTMADGIIEVPVEINLPQNVRVDSQSHIKLKIVNTTDTGND